MPAPAIPAPVRFWAKVDKSGDCWVWTASISDTGYGNFRVTTTTNIQAHRFAWMDLVGPIPQGKVMDHLCRNRACVNPSHLEIVTRRINNVRGESPAAINYQKVVCIRGHDNWKIRPNGWRECLACQRIRAKKRWAATKVSR